MAFSPLFSLQSGIVLFCPSFSLQSGVVYVNRPLDRERVAEYRLTVTVKDNPENIRNARRVITDTARASSRAGGENGPKHPRCF